MFPGFETDIHGLVKDRRNGGVAYYVDCVASKWTPLGVAFVLAEWFGLSRVTWHLAG